MKKLVLVLVLALSVMMIGATAFMVTSGQGQTPSQSNENLAAAWPTVVYMTSNQTFFVSNQTPCSISNNMTGVVTFWPSADNSTVFYSAWISADNITQIALQMKQNGQVGEPVVYLYAPKVMTRSVTVINQTSGLMVIGNFTASNFVGAMSNLSMSNLNTQISQGNISVIASTSQCPMAFRGEFGVFPFVVCNCQGTQATTSNQSQVTTPPGQTPQVQTPQGSPGPCPGGVCQPMGQGPQEPIMPMGPGPMMGPRG